MARGVHADLIGQRFGRLFVLRETVRNSSNNRQWLCRCDCGCEVAVTTSSLTSKRNNTRSCGCLLRETRGRHRITHGMSKSGAHRSWMSMKQRCKHVKEYAHVKVCDRWLNSFESFWIDMGDRPEGTTIDRIDPKGDYVPWNCRWADAKTQANNKNTTRYIEYRGETKPLSSWCDELGLDYSVVAARIDNYGWSVGKALSTKDGTRQRLVEYRGDQKPLSEWCSELGLPYYKTHKRISQLGWSVQRAFEQ